MMNYDKKADALQLVGRVFLAIIFVFAGFSKITGFAGTVAYVGTALPFPELMTVLAIILEFGGGVLLLIGYKTRMAANALILFTVVATLAFHTNFADQLQMTMFLKNVAILGGLLYVTAYGAGAFSLDKKKEMPVV